MKKLFVILLAALLALLPALAEDIEPQATPGFGTDSQGIDTRVGDPGANQFIEFEVDGERVRLGFDPSQQYSSIDGGLVQASFYSYSDDHTKLYEMYIVFPQSAGAGSVVTPYDDVTSAGESSVVLIVSDTNTMEEFYYFSSQMSGTVYPENSGFVISIDDISQADGASTYTGRLSATLIALDMATGDATRTLHIDETPFAFTIGATAENSPVPAPAQTPSDMVKT